MSPSCSVLSWRGWRVNSPPSGHHARYTKFLPWASSKKVEAALAFIPLTADICGRNSCGPDGIKHPSALTVGRQTRFLFLTECSRFESDDSVAVVDWQFSTTGIAVLSVALTLHFQMEKWCVLKSNSCFCVKSIVYRRSSVVYCVKNVPKCNFWWKRCDK